MDEKNAFVVEPEELWPVPPAYVSPWPFVTIAERINAIPPAQCCEGLARLLLDIVHEADLKLAKAQYDNWTLEGLLKEGHE